MTKKEKQLLLADICARLPYGVKVCARFNTGNRYTVDVTAISADRDYIQIRQNDLHPYTGSSVEDIRPYLRSMSSMTEEEREEVEELIKSHKPSPDGIINNKGMDNLLFSVSSTSGYLTDWLNKKMFDYRGLIPMGLALEALEGMYKTE